MKKAIAIEFLWFVAAAILAIPFGFAFLWLLNLSSGKLTEDEQTFMIQLYAIGYVASFIGIYIVRFIIVSLKTLAGDGA
jgi:hypothetical protein